MSTISLKQNTSMLPSNRVYNQIKIFLEDKAVSSKNTAIKYEKDIRYFFRYVRNKEIEQLEPKDLDVSYDEVIACRSHYAKLYKNASTNHRFTALSSLYDFLQKKFDVNKSVFKFKNKLPDDSERVDELSYDEVLKLADLTKTEQSKKEEKYAFLITAIAVGWRLSMLLNIRYSDIRISETDPNSVIIKPKYLDKGKQVEDLVHIKWYEMILGFKGDRSDDDTIFTLTRDEIYGMFNRLLPKAGIDSKRKISPHSLRKTSADLEHLFTNGDIFAVTRHGAWSSPEIVYKRYLKKKRSVTGILLFENIEDDVFNNLSRDELLELIRELPTEYRIQLKRKASELIKQNKNNVDIA